MTAARQLNQESNTASRTHSRQDSEFTNDEEQQSMTDQAEPLTNKNSLIEYEKLTEYAAAE